MPSLLRSSIYNDISSHLKLTTSSITLLLPNARTLEKVYHVIASQTVISCLCSKRIQVLPENSESRILLLFLLLLFWLYIFLLQCNNHLYCQFLAHISPRMVFCSWCKRSVEQVTVALFSRCHLQIQENCFS